MKSGGQLRFSFSQGSILFRDNFSSKEYFEFGRFLYSILCRQWTLKLCLRTTNDNHNHARIAFLNEFVLSPQCSHSFWVSFLFNLRRISNGGRHRGSCWW